MDTRIPSLYKEDIVTFLRHGGSYIIGGFSNIKMEMIGRFLAEDVNFASENL
jgi:hypothetical protein